MDFLRIFKTPELELGLKKVHKGFFGKHKCNDCGGELHFGEDKNDYVWAYCPKCRKIIKTVAIPRFRPPIRIEPDND